MPARRPLLVAAFIVAIAAYLLLPELLRAPSVCVVGDVRARLDGRVPETLRALYLDAKRIAFGFGAGAIGGWEGLGDTVIIAGRAWARTTNKHSPRYYALVANRYFQTNALAYVPPGREAYTRLPLEANRSAQQTWAALARAYPAGAVFAGHVRFAPLSTIAIAEPATGGVSVLKHAARFYTRPMETRREGWAYVVGAAARARRFPPALDAAARERFLPPPDAAGVRAGAYALRLAGEPQDKTRAPPPQAVTGLGQVAGGSVVVEGELAIYPLQRVAACAEAIGR